jgi:PEP-CTERM motif
MKKTCLPLLLSALLIASLSTSVTAATISQTAGYGYNTVTNTWEMEDCAWGINGNGDINNTDFLTFNKFNSSLGTLTGVELELHSLAGGDMTVHNPGGSTTLNISDLKNGVTVYTNVPVFGINNDVFAGLSIPTPTNKKHVPAGGSFSTGTETFTQVNSTFDYTQLNNASFIGTAGSKLDIPIGADNTATISYTGGNPVMAFNNAAGIYATLDYTYTPPVPEPATYALVCMGLGMLGLMRKRNGKNIA